MTQPTQAQIEAVAAAIRDVEEPDMPVFEFIKHARAALTAAAEVKEKPEFGFGPPETAAAEAGYSEPQGTGFQAGEAEPAAAETREQEELETKRLNEIERLYRCIEAYRSELNRAREGAAATIERCAQRMDQLAYAELCADDTAQGSANAKPYQRAAAAIRAMKEQL